MTATLSFLDFIYLILAVGGVVAGATVFIVTYRGAEISRLRHRLSNVELLVIALCERAGVSSDRLGPK